MSSFTSNFKSEAKVLAIPLAMLLACEIGLRLGGDLLSKDARHLRELPAIAARIGRASGPTLLFLGNSLTREGVRLDCVYDEFQRAGLGDVHAFKVNPSDTVMVDWYYLLKSYFVRPGLAPSIVILGYAGHHLDDSANVHASRLASYGDFENVRELFAHDLTDTGDRMDYLCSRISADIALREKVRLRVLAALIPGYRDVANQVNRSVRQKTAGTRPGHATHECLRRFLALCDGAGVLPVVVDMPTPAAEPAAPDVPALVRSAGGVFADLRRVEGITEGLFPDGFHMGPQAAQIYSRALVHRLLDDSRIVSMLRGGSATAASRGAIHAISR